MSGSLNYNKMKPIQRLIDGNIPTDILQKRALKEYEKLKAYKKTLKAVRKAIELCDRHEVAHVLQHFLNLDKEIESITYHEDKETIIGC